MDRGIFADLSHAKTTTYNDLMEIYLYEVTAHRPTKVARDVERTIIGRIRREHKHLCALTIDKLAPEHFEAYRDQRLNTPSPYKRNEDGTRANIAPSTVNRELSILKRVIDHRKRKLGLLVNPANGQDVKRPTVNDERDVRLNEEEKARLLEACYSMRNPLIGPFVEMGFETGARRSNLIRLKWDDVDLIRRTALLRGVKNTRNPHMVINHAIGLTPRAVAVLEALPNDQEEVFPMTINAFKLAFKRARKKAKLTHFHFHDTRHERVSSLFEAGWSTMQVMAQSGHRDPKSVKRYTNIQASHLADALAKLE
ncbi:MAG: site-specific integrase [Pseudomonadota bacterium]